MDANNLADKIPEFNSSGSAQGGNGPVDVTAIAGIRRPKG